MELLNQELIADFITFAVFGGLLLFVLVMLRVALKLTMTLFRLGCLISLFLLGAAGIWIFFLS